MKIPAAMTSPPLVGWDANPSLQGGTNFQQLVEQLERDMWSGAKAGHNDVQALPEPGNVPAQQPSAQQMFAASLAQDASASSDIPLATVDASPRVEPSLPSLAMQTTPVAAPMLQTEQSNNSTPTPTPQAFSVLQAGTSNATKATLVEQSTSARMPQQTTYTANESDRVNLLPGTIMPAVVVRYTGSNEDLPQLKRSLQGVLRRHGINETSLTINGFDTIARIEHGTDHGR